MNAKPPIMKPQETKIDIFTFRQEGGKVSISAAEVEVYEVAESVILEQDARRLVYFLLDAFPRINQDLQ